MELFENIEDDLFKPFEKDEIKNLDAIRAGVKAEDTGMAVWGNCESVIVCQSDSMVDGVRVAGYDCKSHAIAGYGC